MVERKLPKLDVAGSIPVSRSITPPSSLSQRRSKGGSFGEARKMDYNVWYRIVYPDSAERLSPCRAISGFFKGHFSKGIYSVSRGRFRGFHAGTESGRNLRRDIEVSDAQVDEVGKGVQRFKSTGAVFEHAHDAVEAFGGGVGQVRTDEGGDAGGVLSHGADEPAQGFQAALQGCGRPLLEEALGRPARFVAPEVLELVLQAPGAVDASVGLLQGLEGVPVLGRVMGGVMPQHPAQPLEQLAVLAAGLAPLLLAHLVDGFVEGLDDVEPVQDQLGVGTVPADGADEGLAQVAAGPADAVLLGGAEMVAEERVEVSRALPWPTHTTRERPRS